MCSLITPVGSVASGPKARCSTCMASGVPWCQGPKVSSWMGLLATPAMGRCAYLRLGWLVLLKEVGRTAVVAHLVHFQDQALGTRPVEPHSLVPMSSEVEQSPAVVWW